MKQPQPKPVEKEEPAIVLPTIGAVVIYRVPQNVADEVNQLRTTAAHRHAGNKVLAGAELPLIVTKVYEASFNGQVFLDGNDTYWVTEIHYGYEIGDCIEP